MEDIVKELTQAQVDNTHHSPLIYQASHITIEVYQGGQAWLPPGEAMLTTPDDFWILTGPRNGFQD